MSLELFNKLCKSLDSNKGIVQAYSDLDNKEESILFQIRWPGSIVFTVKGWDYSGWYYVERDNQTVSAIFHYKKIEDKTLGIMKSLINEIEHGKYDGKKTLSEKIQEIVQKRQLTSYMNDTKWTELIHDIGEIPDLLIKYKTLFDESVPEYSWTIRGDEHFYEMNMAVIEWFGIEDTITTTEHLGKLLPPVETRKSVRMQLENILQKYSIFYEYDEDKGMFVIYGYR